MDRKQRFYLIISISVVAVAQLLTLLYRPYIYRNNIHDFGFADTIGSLASVIGICCFLWGIKKYPRNKLNKQILLATLAYTVLWEPLGLIGLHGTFDWKDIIAGFISGGFTYILKEIVEKKFKPENIDKLSEKQY